MAENKLIVVESPTKAKTITKFLGSDSGCKVLASNGHIRTLPKEGLCIDIKNGYQPEYIDDPAKIKVISQLKDELKKADELILATDEDREGESISWHLVEVLKPQIPYRRMVFHEITKKAILEAFNNGKDLDMNMVHAQEARRVLDRLYGYTISPVLWSKLSNKSLSAGRVQSPGLRLIVDRERVRLSYKKSEYRDIKVKFVNGLEAKLDSYNGQRIAIGKDFDSSTGEYVGGDKVLLLNFENSKVIVDELKKCGYKNDSIKEREIVERPAPPFTTSTLQQEGNRKLHLAAKDTMKIAQSLYENGFITYMRTDNTALSEEGTNGARNAAAELFGKGFISDSPRHYSANSANAQEAHEAIRPAGDVFQLPENTGLSGKELALYKMIFNRTLASQMKDAIKQSTTVSIQAKSDTANAELSASGTRIEFPGFIKVYVEGNDESETSEDELLLPKLSNDTVLELSGVDSQSHETKAPNRFTEASLVQELEKRGIGRPSTYASIIDRILEKQYVIKEKDSLVPTFTGFGVVQLLEGYFENRIDYGFTSQMEKDLDQIAQGKVEEVEYLKNFYESSNGLLKQIQDVKSTIDPKTVKKLVFPHLKSENAVTIGPYGPYVQTAEGKYASIPDGWTPASVTDEMIENLRKGTSVTGGGSLAPAVVGTTPDGQPILYCTGKFGDYWQIGNRAETENVRRYKIPAYLKGKTVPAEHIMDFFNLPRVVGKDENGNEITADIGRYGAYFKCNDEYRNVKNPEEIFVTTEMEARKIMATPKVPSKKGTAKTAKTYTKKAKSSKADEAASIVKTFGEYEGQMLTIRSGRYGFYLKHGTDNYRIPTKYQHDEEACKGMSPSEALTYLKK